MRNRFGQCCDKYEFKFVANASKIAEVEFTLGRCASCNSYVVDCYSSYGNDPNKYNQPVVISGETAKTILSLTDRTELKDFMDKWFNEE